MQNFWGIILIWTQTYGEIFKYASVYLYMLTLHENDIVLVSTLYVLAFSCIILKNGQTYLKTLVYVWAKRNNRPSVFIYNFKNIYALGEVRIFQKNI